VINTLKSRAIRLAQTSLLALQVVWLKGHEGTKRFSDELNRLDSGETPCKGNPTRGCRMKQACAVIGGVNRRGREKRRGRTIRRSLEASLLVNSNCSSREREGNPRRLCSLSSDEEPGLKRSYALRYSEAHERMNLFFYRNWGRRLAKTEWVLLKKRGRVGSLLIQQAC